MKRYFGILKEVSLHPLSIYNNLSHFLRKCFQLGDAKLSLRPKFQKMDFSCLTHVFQGQVLDNWRNVLKNHERFSLWITWDRKPSFSVVKCVMDEEIKDLSHVPIFKDVNLKIGKHVP